MRGGDEGFYRSCPLRKGHPFELRHDSVKFPRTGHPMSHCSRCEQTTVGLHLGAGRNPRPHSADYAEDRFHHQQDRKLCPTDAALTSISPSDPVLLRFAIRRSCDGRGSQLLKDSVLNNVCPPTVREARLEARDRIRNRQSKNALSATSFFLTIFAATRAIWSEIEWLWSNVERECYPCTV